MISFVIMLSAVLLTLLGLLHVYWAIGGRWGIGAAIPVKQDGTGRAFTGATRQLSGCSRPLFCRFTLSYTYMIETDGVSLRSGYDYSYIIRFNAVRSCRQNEDDAP